MILSFLFVHRRLGETCTDYLWICMDRLPTVSHPPERETEARRDRAVRDEREGSGEECRVRHVSFSRFISADRIFS